MKTFFLAGVSNTIAGITIANGSDLPTSTTAGLPSVTSLVSWNVLTTNATFSNLTVKIKTNTRTATTTFQLIGTSGLNSTVSVATTATGYFTDSVNTDTLTAGTILRVEGTVGGTGAIALTEVAGVYDVSGSDYVSFLGSLLSFSHSASTNFGGFSAATSTVNTTEANHQVRIANNATLRNLSLRVYTNTRTADDTIYVRKNGSNTAITAVIPSGFTGMVQDLSNTTTVVADDLVNLSIVAPTNTGSCGVVAQLEFVGSYGIVGGTNTATPGFGSGVTGYLAVTSAGTNAYTQSDADLAIPLKIVANKFRLRVSANSANYNSVVTLQKNGTDTAVQFTITPSTTGWLSETATNVTVEPGDTLNWKIVNGTGTGSLTFNGFFFDYEEPAPPPSGSLPGNPGNGGGYYRYWYGQGF